MNPENYGDVGTLEKKSAQYGAKKDWVWKHFAPLKFSR
jgi:hypothetical protein